MDEKSGKIVDTTVVPVTDVSLLIHDYSFLFSM